uniref:Uncharacterized protein n=1 Tax=Avena sativa TaxID=4498 RepID=A0ACD6AJT3_AVESA
MNHTSCSPQNIVRSSTLVHTNCFLTVDPPAMKFMNVEKSFAQKHYADLSALPFFPKLVDYIISGPVVAMVWEGKDVVLTGRRIIGATRPWEAAPGTIRGDYAVEVSRNVIHGSDSVENGQKEIALWFPGGLAEWKSNLHPWIYEN